MINHHSLVTMALLPSLTFGQLQTMPEVHTALNLLPFKVRRWSLGRNRILIPKDEDVAVFTEQAIDVFK